MSSESLRRRVKIFLCILQFFSGKGVHTNFRRGGSCKFKMETRVQKHCSCWFSSTNQFHFRFWYVNLNPIFCKAKITHQTLHIQTNWQNLSCWTTITNMNIWDQTGPVTGQNRGVDFGFSVTHFSAPKAPKNVKKWKIWRKNGFNDTFLASDVPKILRKFRINSFNTNLTRQTGC